VQPSGFFFSVDKNKHDLSEVRYTLFCSSVIFFCRFGFALGLRKVSLIM